MAVAAAYEAAVRGAGQHRLGEKSGSGTPPRHRPPTSPSAPAEGGPGCGLSSTHQRWVPPSHQKWAGRKPSVSRRAWTKRASSRRRSFAAQRARSAATASRTVSGWFSASAPARSSNRGTRNDGVPTTCSPAPRRAGGSVIRRDRPQRPASAPGCAGAGRPPRGPEASVWRRQARPPRAPPGLRREPPRVARNTRRLDPRVRRRIRSQKGGEGVAQAGRIRGAQSSRLFSEPVVPPDGEDAQRHQSVQRQQEEQGLRGKRRRARAGGKYRPSLRPRGGPHAPQPINRPPVRRAGNSDRPRTSGPARAARPSG